MKSVSTVGVIAFSLLFILSASLSPSLVAQKNIYKTNYVCFDLKGNERWLASAEISCVDKASNKYMLIEKGQGYFSGFRNRISWVAELEFESTDDAVRPFKAVRHIFDEQGEMLAAEIQEFDFKNNKLVYSYEEFFTERKIKKEFNFQGDIVNRLILGLYIQKFLENGKKEKAVNMFTAEPHLYRINIRVIGKEELSINGQKKIAYKLCLDPDLGLLSVLKTLLPKVYVWHSSLPSFEWLQYKGLENDLSSPRVEIRTLD
jgi:hypothetical protein